MVDKNCTSIPTTVATNELPIRKGLLFYMNSYKRLEETLDWIGSLALNIAFAAAGWLRTTFHFHNKNIRVVLLQVALHFHGVSPILYFYQIVLAHCVAFITILFVLNKLGCGISSHKCPPLSHCKLPLFSKLASAQVSLINVISATTRSYEVETLQSN